MKQYKLKSDLIDRPRRLVLAEDYVAYENRDLVGYEFTRINKADITDFKHGVDWIVWYKSIVGKKFSISFKDKKNKELKILFKSYFGLNRNYYHLYIEIVNDILRYYLQDIVDENVNKFYNNEALSIKGTYIKQKGIQLREQDAIIPWDKINMKQYYGYFAIFDKDHPSHHVRINNHEYETEILWFTVNALLNVIHNAQQSR